MTTALRNKDKSIPLQHSDDFFGRQQFRHVVGEGCGELGVLHPLSWSLGHLLGRVRELPVNYLKPFALSPQS